MLTVETLFSKLARGMLKNTAAVENTNQGEIVPDYIDSMYYLLNEGLNELYTKRPLRKLRIKLDWVDDQNTYDLVDDGVGAYLSKFSEDPDFDESLFVKVLACSAQNPDAKPELEKLRFIPDTNTVGITTPVFNTLRVSDSFQETYPAGIIISYQAKHDVVDSVSDVIQLPPSLEYALQLYISSRYLGEMGSPDQAKRGDELKAAYMREVGEDTAQNLSSTSDVESDMRFTDRGFV